MSKSARRSSRFSMHSKQLGQLLQESGEIKAEHVAKALRIQEKEGGLIGQILRRLNACDENALSSALLKQVQVTDVPCEDLKPDPDVRQYIRRDVCEEEKLCPFEKLGTLLCVVMGNPLNRRAINSIEEATGLKVKPFKAPWPKIKELIEKAYVGGKSSAPVHSEQSDVELDTIQGDFSLDLDQPELAPETIKVPSTISRQSLSAASVQRPPEPKPEEPVIEGLDSLDEGNAEIVEMDARGLARKRRASQRAPVAPKETKPLAPAKVNVDLDAFEADQASEVIAGGDVEGAEHLEELRPVRKSSSPKNATAPDTAPPVAEPIVAQIAEVDDGYFYVDGNAPEEVGQDLLDLIASIPLAKTVAKSREVYLAQFAVSKPAAVRAPIDLTPVVAQKIDEVEFRKLTSGLDTDPVGEWEQKYLSTAPSTVQAYEV